MIYIIPAGDYEGYIKIDKVIEVNEKVDDKDFKEYFHNEYKCKVLPGIKDEQLKNLSGYYDRLIREKENFIKDVQRQHLYIPKYFKDLDDYIAKHESSKYKDKQDCIDKLLDDWVEVVFNSKYYEKAFIDYIINVMGGREVYWEEVIR